MNFVIENPKLLITACVGLAVFCLRMFVFKDSFTPEAYTYIDTILGVVFTALVGRFTRITKSEAKVLETIEDNRNQI